ncbi:CoxG family protein [Ramlibacter humi]|uniref:Carbon monoxide dehydrogenase n=1 Tax=Ramlibacter humi TaxID=2530451 RepID=A0A4Z0BLX4_9BURK|nr:carbon monoxide dehydrogenase subunit G [Ramlibacter humi]TFZ00313.1 carbon monoxide dehydrogenase [Ramlibacter humi]
MDMQGSRVLAAQREQAWEALNDPEVLKACIPGCDRIESTGPNAYSIGMSVKVGPVSAKFTGKIQLEDVNPPESYTLKFEGQGGAAGFGKGSSQVRLEPRDTGCELFYTVNAQVGGKIAQVGQRLVDGVARSMAEDFFKRFEGELAKKHPAPAAESAAPEATAAMAAQASAQAASGIPAWVWALGIAVLVGAVVWLAR